jgi:hypothetical protein
MHLLPPGRFPASRAVIYSQHSRGSKYASPYTDNDIHILPSYDVNTTHDLYLYAIISGPNPEIGSHIFINTPSSAFFRPSVGRKIIPYTPLRPAAIRSIYLTSWVPEVHNSDLLATVFGTCLAIASYAGGLWGTDKKRVLKREASPGRTTILVNCGPDTVTVQKCFSKVRIQYLIDRIHH